MRKVYQEEKSRTGVAMAVILGVGVAGSLFAIIPFSHIIAKPKSLVQLTSAKTVDLPPPVEQEAPPPPPPPEKAEEKPPEIALAAEPQKMTFEGIESAEGTGGAFKGIGDIPKAVETQPTESGVVDVSDLEKRPEVVSMITPAYPSDMRKAKIEGSVTLLCLVSAQGRVEEVQVGSSTRPEFEKPALEAIRKWKFRPGVKDGKDVATYLRFPITFRIPK